MASDDWQNISGPADLVATGVWTEEGAAQAWQLYLEAKDAYRAYKAKRDRFEAELQAGFKDWLPEGREIKFGYNFGKLSIATGEARKAKASKPKGNLADWLSAQSNSGHRS